MPEQKNHIPEKDIIPVELEDGVHYYDPVTSNEVPELFEPYESDNGNNDYDMHEDFEEDGEDENWETDEDSEDGEGNEGENENDGDNTGKKKKDKNNEDEPTEDGGGNDDSGGESSGSNFDSSLVTDHMGETGEKIEKGKELVEDAENLAKAIESEGADLKADWELAKKYGPKAIKTQLISFGAVIAFISIPIILFIMAFMGYGGDNAYGTTLDGDVNIIDGERDDLAREVLARSDITYQSNEYIDIDPDTCYTAPINDPRKEKCVQKPILQLLLTLSDANQKVVVSTLIRDHAYFTSSGNVSRHSLGLAIDIGNDKEFLNLMQWMTNNLLGTTIAPHQILCAGADLVYGTGVVVPAIDNLSVDGGKIFPKFTSIYVGDHTNHIHVGY